MNTPPPPAEIVAIDGPAGAGKSTVGAALAERLGYRFYDTGLLYRAVTLVALQHGVAATDELALTAIADRLNLVFQPAAVDDGRTATVLLDGQDVTWQLREEAVNTTVSTVAALPAVRAALLRQQRAVAAAGRVVMIGRDIGTVVVPAARLKIYLEASVPVRAERRQRDLAARGSALDLASVQQQVSRRDSLDSARATAPLRAASDAVTIDTSDLTIDQVVDRIVRLTRGVDAHVTTG